MVNMNMNEMPGLFTEAAKKPSKSVFIGSPTIQSLPHPPHSALCTRNFALTRPLQPPPHSALCTQNFASRCSSIILDNPNSLKKDLCEPYSRRSQGRQARQPPSGFVRLMSRLILILILISSARLISGLFQSRSGLQRAARGCKGLQGDKNRGGGMRPHNNFRKPEGRPNPAKSD